jgi:hypothetical protein
MTKIRVEYWVPVRCVTELDLADVEAAMHRENDLDGILPQDHPAADAADIAWRLTHGVPVTGPWRTVGRVAPKQVYDDASDLGRLAKTIEAHSGWFHLPVPFLPDDQGKNRADVDEVQDVRVYLPAAGDVS